MNWKIGQQKLPNLNTKRKKTLKKKSLRDQWDCNKSSNIHAIEVEEERKKPGMEKYWKK